LKNLLTNSGRPDVLCLFRKSFFQKKNRKKESSMKVQAKPKGKSRESEDSIVVDPGDLGSSLLVFDPALDAIN